MRKTSDMIDPVFADVESDGFLEDMTRIWTIQIAEGADAPVVVYADQPGFPPLADGVAILKKAPKVVIHYGMGFDIWAINKIFPGTLQPEQVIDSVVVARLINPQSKRHSLADLGEALGLPKGDFDDFSKFTPEMVTYGIRDIEILQKAWKGSKAQKVLSFGRFYEKYQQACDMECLVAYIIATQEQHGFRFDYEKATLLEAELRQELKDIERDMQEIFPPIVTERYSEKQVDKITGKPKRLKDDVEIFNPGSREQVAHRLITKYGWEPIDTTPTGKVKIDETILEGLPYPEAQVFSRYLTVGKMVSQVTSWLQAAVQKPNGDWYVYGKVNTLGCRTHRMSHFGPNMGQVSKKDRRMREVWLPDRGHKLIGIDAEGLELRELAHFLAPFDKGFYARTVHSGDKKLGTAVHQVNQKAAGLYLYDSAKTMIYAHNYGCFDKKLGMIVIEDARAAGKPIPKGSPAKIGKALRVKIEGGIVGLGALIKKCKDQHFKARRMPGHDGRKIPSASDHSALNTLLQGNGSIVMKQAQVIFWQDLRSRNWAHLVHFCATVHDEFQVSCPPEFVEDVMEMGRQAIVKAGVHLGVRCPLVGSADVGDNWADTH
jgi:DNA polymerase-1